MRKTLALWLVLAAAASVALASAPYAPQSVSGSNWSAPLSGTPGSSNDELIIPVEFGPQGGHYGGNPLAVVDSLLFIDSLEGTYANWVSEDLAYSPDTYWHLEDFHALGGSGDAFRCSNPAIACPAENGGYDNHWLQYLVFDAVNLVGASAPQFAVSADWAVEVPGGEPGGYDMWDGWNAWVSLDGGSTWSVLTPSSPAYTGSSSYAFGVEWGMGPGIPAYGAASGGHTSCIFPLTAYIGQSNVKVRVAFCSDPAFSSIDACATTWGLVVDSVRISDGATTLLSNDGVAGGWNGMGGPESPDVWVYEDSTSHSPSWSWNGEQTAYFVNRSIVSYPVTLPAGYQKLKLTYWVWCDLPDFTGGGGPGLEDYYRIMVSTDDGGTWTQVVYDYAYDNGEGHSLNGWVRRTRGLVSGATTVDIPLVFRAVSDPPAMTVRVAFEMTTDGNDDGGSGTGLHIDDVEFIAQRAQLIDLASNTMIIPLPNTVGLQRAWTFRLVNEGLNGISPIRGKLRYTKPDGTFLPAVGDSVVVLSGVLNYGEDTTVTKLLTPAFAGPWQFRTISNATGEQDRTNDTTYSPTPSTNPNSTMGVYVRNAGVYELGYNRRSVTNAYLSERYIHFTPLADGVPAGDAANFDMLQLRVMWRYEPLAVTGATARIRFYAEGVDSFHTGALLHELTTSIDSSETIGAGAIVRWWNTDLSTIPALRNRNGNFWVAVAALDTVGPNSDPAPMPLGTSAALLSGSPDGHNYFWNTSTGVLTQSAGRLLINVVVGQAVENLTIRRGVTPSNDIILHWTAAAGASKYYVWRMTTPTQLYSTGTPLTPGGITTNTYTDVNAISATPRFYVVLAEY